MDALVAGGSSGIGLAISVVLSQEEYERVYIVGKTEPNIYEIPSELRDTFVKKAVFRQCNFVNESLDFLSDISLDSVGAFVYTAGFGRIAPFTALKDAEIINSIRVNEMMPIRLIEAFYHRIHSSGDFYCLVMGSIAGHIASPLFSVYGATKAALCSFIENINIELSCENCVNRILDVSPGAISGTRFYGKDNHLSQIIPLAQEIVKRMYQREICFIPDYEKTYKAVIQHYHNDPADFGRSAYQYKLSSGRLSDTPQMKIGYLSGTFDLFHVGHLNLLRRAKEYCDYLIVGVHTSGAWKGKETFIPFAERVEILKSIKYVDDVITSFQEDSDAWDALHYNYLFVGDDYKGSERFSRYEEYFKGKDVEIIYFPYTKGTSSTVLREKLAKESH